MIKSIKTKLNPILAIVSNGLNHTQFWADVEKGLKSAFSSDKNPGYVKK